jgi:hypothetical protein
MRSLEIAVRWVGGTAFSVARPRRCPQLADHGRDAVLSCRFQCGHELAAKYAGLGVYRKQKVWFTCRDMPFAVAIQGAASHNSMDMDMPPQVLRPGMQHQGEGGHQVVIGRISTTDPLRVVTKFAQGLGSRGKQGVDHPARMCTIQGACAALWAVAIAAGDNRPPSLDLRCGELVRGQRLPYGEVAARTAAVLTVDRAGRWPARQRIVG